MILKYLGCLDKKDYEEAFRTCYSRSWKLKYKNYKLQQGRKAFKNKTMRLNKSKKDKKIRK